MLSNIKIPFCPPDICKQDKESVLNVFDSQWLTGGSKTLEFEKNFAKYLGMRNAIAVNSCTAALHLAMRALNVRKGDEVIVPTMTFAATANAPIFCGGIPVFADIDENTLNISVESIKKKLTNKTLAIIIVHLAGMPCEMDEIMELADENGLKVVEDCAHSLGASYHGKQTGSFGVMSCFSFYPTKSITTGEGGMLVTDDNVLAKKVRLMRSHGITREAFERQDTNSWKYDVTDLGYNFRMPEMSAALGVSQLSRLDEMNDKREKIAKFYTKRLANVKGIEVPYQPAGRISSYHLYTIRVKKEYGMSRDELFKRLAERGIECSVHYTPLHLLGFYRNEFGAKRGDFPIAEKAYEEIISLPLHSGLLPWQMEYIANQVEALGEK
jgi:dTDP-4-amino-4,6-dideoxygalactose transaminase